MDHALRPEGTHYRIEEESGRWWLVGWDQAQGRFWGFRFEQGALPGAEHPAGSIDVGLVDTVDVLARLIGQPIPEHIARELEADQVAFPPLRVDELVEAMPPSMPGDLEGEGGRVRVAAPGLEVIATGYRRSGVVVRDVDSAISAFYPLATWQSAESAVSDSDRLTTYPTFEQVTRPGIYPVTFLANALPGRGVDIRHASVATLRTVDPDRGDARAADIELVRLSGLSWEGVFAGGDVWLRWETVTETWERVPDPRVATGLDEFIVMPALHPGSHTPPESWTLEHEIRAIEAYETADLPDFLRDSAIEGLDDDPSEFGGLD